MMDYVIIICVWCFVLHLDVVGVVNAFTVVPSTAVASSATCPSKLVQCYSAADDANSDGENDDNSQEGKNGSPPDMKRPNKLNLYDEDELADLLQLHSSLYPSMIESASKLGNQNSRDSNRNDDNNAFPSLHELVMQTIEDIDDEQQELGDDSSSESWLPSSIESKLQYIQAIASDVDGTILDTKDQQVHPRTLQSIVQAVDIARSNRESIGNGPAESLQWFFPATGKSRAGALYSLGAELRSVLQDGPGVYCQGLYCVGRDGQTVVFEKKLTTEAIQATEQLVEFTGTSIIAYDGDDLYTTDLNPTVIELHAKWGEPLSTQIDSIAGYANGVHKILVCDNDAEKIRNVVRPQLEKVASETGSVVTQAIPTMLEILPEGCSKALGVTKLCEELGIDPKSQLLAIGDAENDVEMLKMASVGVAVGNANDMAKAAADVVVPLTSCEGGAGLTIERVLTAKKDK